MITNRTARELVRVSYKLWGRSIKLELRTGEVNSGLVFATDGYLLVFIEKTALREPLSGSGFQLADDQEVELTKRWWQAWKKEKAEVGIPAKPIEVESKRLCLDDVLILARKDGILTGFMASYLRVINHETFGELSFKHAKDPKRSSGGYILVYEDDRLAFISSEAGVFSRETITIDSLIVNLGELWEDDSL